MTTTQGGVDDVTTAADNNKALTDIMVTLARLEEGIKPLAHLPQLLQDVKEVAKDASGQADKANTRLDNLEPAVSAAEDLADEAHRLSLEAIKRLDEQRDEGKWFRRTFYGVFITAAGGGIIAAIVGAFHLGAN